MCNQEENGQNIEDKTILNHLFEVLNEKVETDAGLGKFTDLFVDNSSDYKMDRRS
jgi:hypothetical protein